jgi:hypothetical protein
MAFAERHTSINQLFEKKNCVIEKYFLTLHRFLE